MTVEVNEEAIEALWQRYETLSIRVSALSEEFEERIGKLERELATRKEVVQQCLPMGVSTAAFERRDKLLAVIASHAPDWTFAPHGEGLLGVHDEHPYIELEVEFITNAALKGCPCFQGHLNLEYEDPRSIGFRTFVANQPFVSWLDETLANFLNEARLVYHNVTGREMPQ